MIEEMSVHAGETLSADVCIVGAGPAGITIARMLAGAQKRVILAEGGGMSFEKSSQDLYEGASTGQVDYPLSLTRLRYFGGTSNHWTGMCAPLTALDFEKRSWVDRSGWPFGLDDLMPFYRRAHEVLDLGPFEYSLERMRSYVQFLEFGGGLLENRAYRRSTPTRFRQKYRHEIESSDHMRCLLHANFLGFEASDDGSRILGITVGDGASAPTTLRAEVFIVACGGVENARLMLLSPASVKRAMGPSAEMIGRCFLDHVWNRNAVWFYPDGDWWKAYSGFEHEGIKITPGFCSSEELARRERLQGFGVTIMSVELPEEVRADETCVTCSVHCEAAPNPDSRITLDRSRTDRLGLPRAEVHWRLSESDRSSMWRGMTVFAQELGRMRLGRARLGPGLSKVVFPHGTAIESHHMGTTRMAEDPDAGVVDATCKVHGVDNLYVAGSSVYPTSGYVNPTLTLIAMAMRLAEHVNTIV